MADDAAPGVVGSPVAQLAPVALSMLAVSNGAEVEVRAVHSGTLTVAGAPR